MGLASPPETRHSRRSGRGGEGRADAILIGGWLQIQPAVVEQLAAPAVTSMIWPGEGPRR
jgi:hypothetical protein